MSRRRTRAAASIAVLVAACFSGPVRADDAARPAVPEAYTSERGPAPDPTDVPGLVDFIRANPDLVNALIGRQFAAPSRLDLLKGLTFEPKLLTADSTGREPAALGLSYSYRRSLALQEIGQHTDPLDLGFDLSADGTVAFSRELNPSDFLKSSASLTARQFRTKLNRTDFREAEAETLQALGAAAANFAGDDPDELDRSPEWSAFQQRLQQHVLSRAGTEVFWSFGGSASLESNQAFTSKQWSYGAEGALAIRSWDHNQFAELFDAPFAMARVLTGADARFTPSGRAWPTLVVGLDQVDPKDNKQRAKLAGGDAKFARVRFELETRAPVARVGAADLWLNLDWRVFQELGADAAIEQAGQDAFSYFVATLSLPSGWMASYAEGRLPFDARDTARWELGWSFNVGEAAKRGGN